MKNKALPTEFPKLTIDAIEAGATKVFIPIDIEITHDKYGYSHSNNNLETSRVNSGWYQSLETLYEHLIRKDSSLQINQGYFVVEEFVDTFDHDIFYKYDGGIVSETDFPDGRGSFKIENVPWQDASEMQQHQSRIPSITPTCVEVKSVDQLIDKEIIGLGIEQADTEVSFNGIDTHCVMIKIEETFKHWYDKQYPNQPYDSDPYGFLVTLKVGG